MSQLNDVPYLTNLRAEADYSDVKFALGSNSLREVVARMFSYMPLWLRVLYAIRFVLAAILRLDSTGLPSAQQLSADDVPMTQGEKFSWITVERAEENKYWSAKIKDHHLDVWLTITCDEMLDDISRYGLSTFVQFNNRSGRFYLWLIKPFHHIVVRAMLKYAVNP